jgi:plastocyanin
MRFSRSTSTRNRTVPAIAALLCASVLALAGCASGAEEGSDVEALSGSSAPAEPVTSGGSKDRASGSRLTDPRAGGLQVTLGEWAVTPEAKVIRPGPTTFAISNRGTMLHGFEIEADGDHSGPGGGDGFKLETRLIEPGETIKVRVDLAPGTYEIECLVEGHDDMGMENVLHVQRGAPLAEPDTRSDAPQVSIEDFSFAPRHLEVPAGTEVTWINRDPTEHTVTADGPGFGSDTLSQGGRFSVRLDEPGTYDYHCAIHPEMTARVTVSR